MRPQRRLRRGGSKYLTDLLAKQPEAPAWRDLWPWVERARAGDEEAFAVVLASSAPMIVGCLRRYPRAEAQGHDDDIVAGAVAGVRAAVGAWDPALGAWSTCARRHILVRAKRAQQRAVDTIQIPYGLRERTRGAGAALPRVVRLSPARERGLGRRRPASAPETPSVAGLLDALPPQEREIMRLRYGIGEARPLTLAEVAARLGQTRLAVRIAEARALRALGGGAA